MPNTMTHPAHRAVHAVNNAAQLARALHDAAVPRDAQEASIRISELLADVPADVSALYSLSQAQSAEILELREQGIRDKQYIDRIEDKNTALNEHLIAANNKLAQASREAEQLLQGASIRLQGETADFNRVRALRDTLHESTFVGADYIIVNEPRIAAAGGQ